MLISYEIISPELLFHYLDDIFVMHFVSKSNSLRGELAACSPDECVFEYFWECSVNGVADVFDGDPVAQNNGVGEVRSVARLFGKNSDQIKMRP